MEKIVVGLGVGLIAAVIEVLLVRTYQKNKVVLSAIGAHWLAVGLLMPHVNLGVSVWLKGIIVGVILTVPFVILEIQKSKNAIIHTAIFAPIWGVVIAYGTFYLGK